MFSPFDSLSSATSSRESCTTDLEELWEEEVCACADTERARKT